LVSAAGANLGRFFLIAVQLFFTTFSPQMQILHAPSWTAEGKPQILIDAMRACGALYDRNRRAAAFIVSTLAIARDTLPGYFVSNTPRLFLCTELSLTGAVPLPPIRVVQAKQYTPLDQRYLLISVTLFQAVGLFHQKAETRASHNVFHRMLVQVSTGDRATGLPMRSG
jgi:hypothetical protein